jgi:hypothetical protein
MKKILFVLSLVMTTLLYAQDEHLTFKGIPIDGTLESVTQQLEAKGYTRLDADDDLQIMSGDFAGYSNCQLIISTVKNLDLTYLVLVSFEKKTTWHDLYGNYKSLKDLLAKKYGEPSTNIEQFHRKITPGYEMYYLDECRYTTLYELELGKILLTISKDAQVILAYYDRTNLEIKEQADLQEALDDL